MRVLWGRKCWIVPQKQTKLHMFHFFFTPFYTQKTPRSQTEPYKWDHSLRRRNCYDWRAVEPRTRLSGRKSMLIDAITIIERKQLLDPGIHRTRGAARPFSFPPRKMHRFSVLTAKYFSISCRDSVSVLKGRPSKCLLRAPLFHLTSRTFSHGSTIATTIR